MNTYKIKYNHKGVIGEMRLDASSPIPAINKFHRIMQMERKVLPENYRMTEMDWIYMENGLHTPMHSQPVDIPNSPTPDLSPVKTKCLETQEFAFAQGL
jgi:hypothetical protein